MKQKKPTVAEIVELKGLLTTYYQAWYEQMKEDDRYYTQKYQVFPDGGTPPDNFVQVRPPSATQVIEMAADHSTGNAPRLHVPRRKETAKAQAQTTIMEKAGAGFWYRTIANSSTNVLRAWAQSAALRGAICGSLLYDPDAMPDKPLPSELGGIDSQAYKDADEEYTALAQSAWPFKLDYVDPLTVLPDPETDGRTYVIIAFKDKALNVKRRWPNWDYRVPGHDEPLKPTDEVEFLKYADNLYRSYIVSGVGLPQGRALQESYDGVQKHGYGFGPYFFAPGGFGSPFGKPEDRFAGLITRARDLFALEARRETHKDALIGQQAFPNTVVVPGLELNKSLGGYMVAPSGIKPSEAIWESRPVIPVQEIVVELQSIRAAIQRATLPDSLSSEPSKSDESGYLRSLKIGTGRSRIRSLTDSLERACEWATSGFYRLVENKVRGPVAIWGKGMGAEDEFVTIRPENINGHYEVYVSLTPSLPQDESMDIANGEKLYQGGGISKRYELENYAHIENADEVMTERLAEDFLRSQPVFARLVQDVMAVTMNTPGPIGVPGFAAGLQSPAGPLPGAAPMANPQSMAGVGAPRSIPTPPAAPGSVAESNNIIGRTSSVGPTTQGPVQGIPRGPR
jgi:hypothetical protein